MREIFNSMVKIQIFDENRKESLVNWKWLILEDSKRSFTLLFYTLMHFVKNQFWKSVRRKKTFKFNLELLLILRHLMLLFHDTTNFFARASCVTFSSLATRWSHKPGVVSSNRDGGIKIFCLLKIKISVFWGQNLNCMSKISMIDA